MPIINTQISETKNITENGTYDVAKYTTAIVNTPVAPALYRELQINGSGILVSNTTTTHIIDFTGITDVAEYVLTNAYYQNTGISGNVNMNSLTTISGNYACQNMFRGCSLLTGCSLNSLTTISGKNACYFMFEGCNSLTDYNLNSLTVISGETACQNMFDTCRGLTNMALPSLTTISGYNSCSGMFANCSNIISADLSALTTISGSNGCQSMFGACVELTNIDISSLTTISGGYGCQSMFSTCRKLTSVNFASLNEITGTNCCRFMFSPCPVLTSLFFPALTSNSFGTRTNQFNNMLQGVTGCTVHFPMRIQSKIGSWADVTAGFGGTNTTVLFDIVCTLTGSDTNTYTRSQKHSTNTATAWDNGGTLYYTSGTTEPAVGDTIYSDAACTTAVTTISSIS